MASDPSDWEPLPEEEAVRFPGEAASLTPRAPAGKSSAASAAATGAGPGVDTMAGTAMPGLLGSTEAQTSMLVQMMRTEMPTQRRGGAAPARTPRDGADAREREPWFQAMPAVEQDRLRRAWVAERTGRTEERRPEPAPVVTVAAPPPAPPKAPAVAPATGTRSQELLEWFWVAYVVFFVAALPLMLTEGLAGFVRMAMAGCVTGIVWQIVPRTRFSCIASAVAVYCAVVMAPRFGELIDSPFDLLVSLGGGVLVGYLASLGAMHEEKLAARRPATGVNEATPR